MLIDKRIQDVLGKSYPFHDSDLSALPELSTGAAAAAAAAAANTHQYTYPDINEGFPNKKIRIHPSSHMVYFDDSPSRRAFSLIRANEVHPNTLIKKPSTLRSTKRSRQKYPKSSLGMSSMLNRYKSSTHRSYFMPTSSPRSTLHVGGSAIGPLSVSARPVLRSKINTNSAQETERLMVLKAEQQQRRAELYGDGHGDTSSGDESVPRDSQYPHGTRSSVKELYSAMRLAQVADYSMKYELGMSGV